MYTWECPASLEEVIVVGYWGCCLRLCPVGIDLAIPVAVLKLYNENYNSNNLNDIEMKKKTK